MSQPTSTRDIKVIDIRVEKCGLLKDDPKFSKVREKLKKQQEDAREEAGQHISQASPNEAVSFSDDVFEIIADFKAIPSDEVYCRVSDGCVEVGAIHKETQGTGPNARHLDIQLTRLYQSPRAINITSVQCFLSSDGVLLVTGPYKTDTPTEHQQHKQSISK